MLITLPFQHMMLEAVSMKRKYCDENIFSILRLFHLICRYSQEWHCVRWRRRWGECLCADEKQKKNSTSKRFSSGEISIHFLSFLLPDVSSPRRFVCAARMSDLSTISKEHTRASHVTRRLTNTLCLSCAYISPTSLGLITKFTFHVSPALLFSTLLSPTSRRKYMCRKKYLQSSSPGWIEFPLVLRRINSRINNLLYALSRNVVVVDCEWLIALHHRKAGFRHASISPVP